MTGYFSPLTGGMRRDGAMAYDVVRVTETRGGCVYRTEVLTTLWLKPKEVGYGDEAVKREIARRHGGDSLAPNIRAVP